jgi:UDP-N-acetylglucosamine diphosphorylase/glucosamine-1-phosphate N-acetyltransferase
VTVEVPGFLLRGAFDLIPALDALLAEDVARLRVGGESDPVPPASIVLGDPGLLGLYGALVEPGVVFDLTEGPIVLESGVEVRAGTRLAGPLWAGANTRLLGGELRRSAIGPRCIVRGEVASTVFLGFANKAHDGFVGHSVIGRWVNLGAGTITSNLKNTYGAIHLDIRGQRLETGLQNLGTLAGDHAKTAIGTLLATGTVLGAGASVFDVVRPPRWVPPFAWGGAGPERMTREGFLTIAGRVLPRRDVALDAATRACLERIYDWATA